MLILCVVMTCAAASFGVDIAPPPRPAGQPLHQVGDGVLEMPTPHDDAPYVSDFHSGLSWMLSDAGRRQARRLYHEDQRRKEIESARKDLQWTLERRDRLEREWLDAKKLSDEANAELARATAHRIEQERLYEITAEKVRWSDTSEAEHSQKIASYERMVRVWWRILIAAVLLLVLAYIIPAIRRSRR